MRPSASPSGARIRANVSLTIATRTAPRHVGADDRAPPHDRQPQDVEVALVDAGVVRLALAVPNAIVSIELPSIRGSRLVKATAVTPGVAATRSRTAA